MDQAGDDDLFGLARDGLRGGGVGLQMWRPVSGVTIAADHHARGRMLNKKPGAGQKLVQGVRCAEMPCRGLPT